MKNDTLLEFLRKQPDPDELHDYFVCSQKIVLINFLTGEAVEFI